jgi:hypothetical protein
VRVLDSQWLELDTFESLLVKVTSHEVAALAVTLNDWLFVVRVRSAADVAFVRGFWYS